MSDQLPTPAEVARMLAAASGREITETMIREDINNGAPVNPDGSMNLIDYAAWLVREDLSYEQVNVRRTRRKYDPS